MAEHQENVTLIVNPMRYAFREYVAVHQNV